MTTNPEGPGTPVAASTRAPSSPASAGETGHAAPTTPLRLAVEHRGGWTELTDPGQSADQVTRIRTGGLADAARLAARAPRPAFIDIQVLLARSVNDAFLAFADEHPGWSAGTRAEAIVHPGTAATLAGLLWDIWAAGVAPGVTLQARDSATLIDKLRTEVLPLLAARGLRVEVNSHKLDAQPAAA